MATKKKTKEPSQGEMNNNLRKAKALEKIVEHNRDFLKLDITLPLGNPALKQVHTNQWLWTALPKKQFDLVNWGIIAKALNSNVNRYEGYVRNRWYIESNDITVDVAGNKAEMKLGVNAFASSYNTYSNAYRAMMKAYTDATTQKNTTKKSSASKSTSNALAANNGALINESWVKKYNVPKIVVDKVKGCCKQGNTEEQNVRAWHEWMDAHVQWVYYNDHQRSMEQVINMGNGNCVDNSIVFRAGCLALGVKCRYMQGNTCCQGGDCANHQWNIVYFSNGKKVVVDNGRGDASWGSHWGSCSGGEWETDSSW